MEEKETKKKVFIGETGNKAEVTEETRNPQSIEGQHTRDLLRRGAKMYCPDGADYVGAAVVYYYQKQGLSGPQYFTACQVDAEKLIDPLADLGWKNLRSALMQAFGRPEPRTRG